jgi:hypothetical protein
MASIIKASVFHEEAFYEHFVSIRRGATRLAVWGGHGLETTYGKDLDTVRNSDPNFVWTVVDGEDCAQWILPGYHYVNRICYLVTEKPHHFAPIEFRVRNDTLTPLGLRRQVARLLRLTKEYASVA